MQKPSNNMNKDHPKWVATASQNTGSISAPHHRANYHCANLPVISCGRGLSKQYLLQSYQNPNNGTINAQKTLRPGSKRPITLEQFHQMRRDALEKTKEGRTNKTNQETEGVQPRRQKSKESSVGVDASPRVFELDDIEGCLLNTSSPKTNLKAGSRVVRGNSESPIPVSYPPMQAFPSHVLPQTPNCFIPMPFMYPNPAINMVRPTLHRTPFTHFNKNCNVPVQNGQVASSSRSVTFAANPLFEGRTSRMERNPNSNQQAIDLKKQITKNVEQLFQLATSKSSSNLNQNKDLDVDQINNANPLACPIENLKLMQTVMTCCLEVESYWTRMSTDGSSRALILGCCKNIKTLILNDIRKTANDNIVSSLQELTLSLILLFLISSLK